MIKKPRIRKIPKEIPTDFIGCYLPASNTIWYAGELDQMPELKDFVLKHELKHAEMLSLITNKALFVNLKHELVEQIKTSTPDMIKKKLELAKIKGDILSKEQGFKKRHAPMLFLYSAVYGLFVLFNNAFLTPICVYYAIRSKNLTAYLAQGGYINIIIYLAILNWIRVMLWS